MDQNQEINLKQNTQNFQPINGGESVPNPLTSHKISTHRQKLVFIGLSVLLLFVVGVFFAMVKIFDLGGKNQVESVQKNVTLNSTNTITDRPAQEQAVVFESRFGKINFPSNPSEESVSVKILPEEVLKILPVGLKNTRVSRLVFSDGREGFRVIGAQADMAVENLFFKLPSNFSVWRELTGFRSAAAAFREYESEKSFLRITLIKDSPEQGAATQVVAQIIQK